MNRSARLLAMLVSALCFAAMGGIAAADCTGCSSAQASVCTPGSTVHIAGPATLVLPANVAPFSPAANFMSLCGFARWQHAQKTGEWLPRPEACPPLVGQPAGGAAKRPVACVDDPFAPEVNFMSGCGYHRWRHYKETGVWLPGCEICKVVHGG